MATFCDTNVLVYSFDRSDPAKHTRAREVLETTDGLVFSTQVLLEYFVVVTRKLRPALPEDAARAVVAELSRLDVVPADAELVRRAIDTSVTERLSVWDAMIIEAAVEAGCERILTEDLATGSTIRGVEVIDPFAV